jgi:hypothetical protein
MGTINVRKTEASMSFTGTGSLKQDVPAPARLAGEASSLSPSKSLDVSLARLRSLPILRSFRSELKEFQSSEIEKLLARILDNLSDSSGVSASELLGGVPT